jgi:hypothetical protein
MDRTVFGVVMIGIGLVMIIRGLTATHLYNDTEGPISDEELDRAIAKPRDRLLALCAGCVSIALGIYSLSS